ncbi:MAG: glutamate--tRNA ligase [Micavibrio sp.]|nr:glutamate--tRNA ligase [Micavibrio sp.]
MTVITRFPPSPTGFMHIGNARTAMFNWLFAKHEKGKMLLRIEDTDRTRHSEEAVQAIYDGMNWLGLSWDGDAVSQFSRSDRHTEVAEALLEKGMAYKCYCTSEELEAMREKAQKEGLPTFYDRRWRDKDENDAPADVKPVIRIKAPLTGETVIEDKVQGKITIKNEQLDDFIILRSDGTPTYMLAVVVDDNDMGVTHVLRGDDHMNNAFRQKIIIEAMGWDTPIYGHMPMILGPDGSKLSKRHGAVSLEDFQAMGYLPEAVFNYLLRLGWSHGNDEIISREQAIEWFTIDNIGHSPSKFDYDKLENLNAHYIKELDNERFSILVQDFWTKLKVPQISEDMLKGFLQLADELKSRAKTLKQAAEESVFLSYSAEYNFEGDALNILTDDALTLLKDLKRSLSGLDDFSTDSVQSACKQFAKENVDGKLGKIGMPLRAAITGRTQSPSVFACASVLGKDEVLRRIDFAIDKLSS